MIENPVGQTVHQQCDQHGVSHPFIATNPGLNRAIYADGEKSTILTDELLSAVYETPVRVARLDGYYLAYPG